MAPSSLRAHWGRGVQWAGALVPATAAAVVLPLGVLSSPPGRPTHPQTPCTAHLRTIDVPPVPDGVIGVLPKQGRVS
jgi:hypothetical protein